MRKIQLECIVYRKMGNKIEFLLMKRIPEKGGFWQPPCGGMEKRDKSFKDTAFRELSEEANISKKDILQIIENVHYFEINKHYITGEPIPTIKEVVFGFEVKPNTKISINKNICTEHERFKWVSFKEAIKILKWDNNKEALKKLNCLLKKTEIKNEMRNMQEKD